MVGHGKMGAAAGCVVGHHNANKKQRQSKSKSNRTAQAINLDHQKRRGRA
jgi:hypothetical protein